MERRSNMLYDVDIMLEYEYRRMMSNVSVSDIYDILEEFKEKGTVVDIRILFDNRVVTFLTTTEHQINWLYELGLNKLTESRLLLWKPINTTTKNKTKSIKKKL